MNAMDCSFGAYELLAGDWTSFEHGLRGIVGGGAKFRIGPAERKAMRFLGRRIGFLDCIPMSLVTANDPFFWLDHSFSSAEIQTDLGTFDFQQVSLSFLARGHLLAIFHILYVATAAALVAINKLHTRSFSN